MQDVRNQFNSSSVKIENIIKTKKDFNIKGEEEKREATIAGVLPNPKIPYQLKSFFERLGKEF